MNMDQHAPLSEEDSENHLANISSDAEFAFGFNVSTNQISDLFQIVAHDTNFELIESQQYHATAIKQKKKNFMQILDCFNWWTEGNVTAVKMIITTREKDSKRICRVRGLIGSRKQVCEFINRFSQKSKLLANSKYISMNDEVQMKEQQTNPFYLQSCAVYMFHKILSNEKYGIGNIIFSSINNFNAEFEDSKQACKSLPLPMKKAIGITEEVVENLYKDFNYGRQQMQQIMPYCRISVQKYVFEKINGTLFALYVASNQEQQKQFEIKKQQIRNKVPIDTIFKEIGLPPKLQFIQNQEEELLKKPGLLFNSETARKYIKASRQLERITSTLNPRQKIKHCQIMFTYLKTIVYEESKAKYQLFNMEDIIPVLILILLISEIPFLKSQLNLMNDFIANDPCDLDSQKRLITNLSQSLNFIIRDLKL